MPNTINILAVEDDEFDLKEIKEAIEETGEKNYKLFSDPSEFVETVTNRFHIFIIDHKLGGVTGLDMVAGIKSKNQWPFIIIYTGYDDRNLLVQYCNAGVNKIVGKWQDDRKKLLTKFITEGITSFRENIEMAKEFKSLKINRT